MELKILYHLYLPRFWNHLAPREFELFEESPVMTSQESLFGKYIYLSYTKTLLIVIVQEVSQQREIRGKESSRKATSLSILKKALIRHYSKSYW